ncbi:hypothetical protein BDV93DRAFT_38502 [Ceratobasidium sp. AG-I]|nr:hypothetical protein BDV93DRAFT_38502 [Ceratobasidium sp. AG-I]
MRVGQVAERIVQLCSSTAAVQHLSVDPTCSTLRTPGNSSCCCSSVTYALVAGCWVCQTSRLSLLTTTYQLWLASCPEPIIYGDVPLPVKNARPTITVPAWAFVQPANVNRVWNMSLAQQHANYTPSATTAPFNPSSTTSSPSTASSPTSTGAPTSSAPSASNSEPPPRTASNAAIIAIVSATLLIVVAMSFFLYRRHRQKHRISSSTPPPPGFLIDENTSPDDTHDLDHFYAQGGKWGWWKRWKEARDEERRRKETSDPGKIDAWRYPFEYTPVSPEVACTCAECMASRPTTGLGMHGVGPGGSGSGGSAGAGPNGGAAVAYDPYPGGSRVTLLIPDESRRPSTETLLPGRVSNSPVPGPSHTRHSPIPGTSHARSYSNQNTLFPPPAQSPHQQLVPHTPPSYTSSRHLHSQNHPSVEPPRTPAPIPTSHSPLPPHAQHQHQHTLPHARSYQHLSPTTHVPSHTHTYELRLSPGELVDLPPDIRARIRPRGRRRHRDREGRREGQGSGDGGGGGGEGSGSGRPRSLSVPVNIPTTDLDTEPEPEGPRNGPELREKYRGRRNTDADDHRPQGARVSPVRDRRETSGGGGVVRTGEGLDGRAVDGGISLMGGPPRRVR